jgi:hypothetical protein
VTACRMSAGRVDRRVPWEVAHRLRQSPSTPNGRRHVPHPLQKAAQVDPLPKQALSREAQGEGPRASFAHLPSASTLLTPGNPGLNPMHRLGHEAVHRFFVTPTGIGGDGRRESAALFELC